MASLHKTTEETRLVLRWLAIFIGCFFVFFILLKTAIAIKQHFTPPPPPTVAFGILSPIVFPQTATSSMSLSYSLNTLTGVLPSFPDRETIYKTADFEPNLLSLERAQDKVATDGFDNSGVLQNGSTYIWQSSPQNNTQYDFNRKLILDTSFYNFNLTSDYLNNASLISTTLTPTSTDSIQAAKTFITNIATFPNDIDSTKTITTPFAIVDNTLTKASSLSQAQVVRVSFRQQDLNSLPIVYPDPSSSTMNFYITWESNPPQIGEAHFFHESITEVSATYPLKTSLQAFDDLQKGKAYIASSDGNTNQVITNIYLAYYATNQAQQYIMPVVVFEGNNNFVAYVSAVADDWIKKN